MLNPLGITCRCGESPLVICNTFLSLRGMKFMGGDITAPAASSQRVGDGRATFSVGAMRETLL